MSETAVAVARDCATRSTSALHPEDREPTRLTPATAISEHRPYDVIYRTVDPVSGAHKWIRAVGDAV